MKIIKFNRPDKSSGWAPYGFWGWLWRALAFLVMLFVLIVLLSMVRSCNDERSNFVDGQNLLPSESANRIPRFSDDDIVPNPENGGATEIVADLLYLIFDSVPNDSIYVRFAQELDSLYPTPTAKIEYYNPTAKTSVIRVPKESRDSICDALPRQITDLKFYITTVEVMVQNQQSAAPAQSQYASLWYLDPIQAKRAWSVSKGSTDIVIGVVDSYFDINHEAFGQDKIVKPFSMVNMDSIVSSPSGTSAEWAGHGTMVASIAAGAATEKSSGIAPRCKIMPVSLGTQITTMSMVEGLLYCMYNGCNVINLSMGAQFTDVALQMSVDQQIEFANTQGLKAQEMWDYVFRLADDRNVTIVWAAGNDNVYDAMDVSKRCGSTVRVSAVNKELKKSEFSNFGNFPDRNIYESTISAPGEKIYGALPGNKYESWDGTSFSAPIAAGAIALLKSVNPSITNSQIVEILKSTGRPIESNTTIGNVLQIYDALNKARSAVPQDSVTTQQNQIEN